MITIDQINKQRENDRLTLKALADAGSNLCVPHEIEHHFVSSSKASLEAILNKGRLFGYKVEKIQVIGNGEYFSIDLKKFIVPDANNIFKDSEEMLRLAEKYQVEYDGWGTSVENGS